MKKTLAFAIASKQGEWPVMEDAYYANPVHGDFILVDAFGGNNGPETASNVVRDIALALHNCRKNKSIIDEVFLRALLREQNESLLIKASKTKFADRSAASILIVCKLTETRFLFCNVGACGAMILRFQQNIPIVLPQTFGAELSFPLSALGMKKDLFPEFRILEAKANEIFAMYTESVAKELLHDLSFAREELSKIPENMLSAASPRKNASVLIFQA